MRWTLRTRRNDEKHLQPLVPTDKVDNVDVELVHWTGRPGKDEDVECRVIRIKIEQDGSVEVEHSTSDGEEGFSVEHLTRVYLPGWDSSEWPEEEQA